MSEEENQIDAKLLARGLKAVEDLMNDSRGVADLHLNGDVAPWHTVRTGGAFESWLIEFDEALALAKRKGWCD